MGSKDMLIKAFQEAFPREVQHSRAEKLGTSLANLMKHWDDLIESKVPPLAYRSHEKNHAGWIRGLKMAVLGTRAKGLRSSAFPWYHCCCTC